MFFFVNKSNEKEEVSSNRNHELLLAKVFQSFLLILPPLFKKPLPSPNPPAPHLLHLKHLQRFRHLAALAIARVAFQESVLEKALDPFEAWAAAGHLLFDDLNGSTTTSGGLCGAKVRCLLEGGQDPGTSI